MPIGSSANSRGVGDWMHFTISTPLMSKNEDLSLFLETFLKVSYHVTTSRTSAKESAVYLRIKRDEKDIDSLSATVRELHDTNIAQLDLFGHFCCIRFRNDNVYAFQIEFSCTMNYTLFEFKS